MTPEDLRAARKSLGLNQQQMSAALGYSAYSRISEFERGAQPIPPLVAKYVAALLSGYRPTDWPTA